MTSSTHRRLLGAACALAGMAALVGCLTQPGSPSAAAPTAAPVLPASMVLPVASQEKPPVNLGPAPEWNGPLPPRLLGNTVRDWSLDRIGGRRISTDRLAAHPPAEERARKLQAAVGASTPWGATGLPITGFLNAGVPLTGVATNGPAWAYRSPVASLAGRIWYVTTTGWLLGVDTTAPLTAVGARKYLTLNLGHACTRGYVSLADDGMRAYVVTDDGYLMACNLQTMTANAHLIDVAGAASVGVAAFIDPFQSNFQNNAKDTVFAATNAGRIARFVFNDVTLAGPPQVRTGVSAAQALDGTANLLDTPVITLNNRCYYGDRAGYAHVLDFNLAVGAPDLQSLYLGQGLAVDAPVAVDLNFANQVTDVFLNAGTRMAWSKITLATGVLNAPTLSPDLVLDCNVGGLPFQASGNLGAFPYTNVKSIANTNATVACTAMVPSPAPMAPGTVLWKGDNLPPTQSFRTASIGGAKTIDANVPTTKTIYGFPNNSGDTKNKADLTGNLNKINQPLDLQIGPEGEIYLGGVGGNDAKNVRWIPSIAYPMPTGLFGYGATTNVLAGRGYLMAGPDTGGVSNPPTYVAPGAGGNPVKALNIPHGTWYDTRGTAGVRADDFLWISDWEDGANGTINRLMVGNASGVAGGYAGRVDRMAGQTAGGNNVHPLNTKLVALTAQLNGVHGCCQDNAGLLYFSEANHNHLMVYDPNGLGAGAPSVMNCGDYPGCTGPDHLVNLNFASTLGAQGSVLCPNRDGDVIYRYDVATKVITVLVGKYHDISKAGSLNGELPTSGCINGPEAACVNPVTGDIYIAEDVGKMVKVYYQSGPNAGLVYRLAGDGTNTFAPGNAGVGIGLGWISGIQIGPLDLATPNLNKNAALYLALRTQSAVVSLIFPPPTAATTEGLMRWDFSAVAPSIANWYILHGVLTATALNTTNAPRPDLVQTSTFLQDNITIWSPNISLTPNTAPTPNPALTSTFITGEDGNFLRSWTANTTLGQWNLTYQKLAANANISQAFVEPTTGPYNTHYVNGQGYTHNAVDIDSVDFNPVGSANPPKLAMTVSKYASTGILSPPVIFSSANQYLYVMNNNALFRLDYSSAANFANPAKATFCCSRLGALANGLIDTVSAPVSYISNPTPPLVTDLGAVYAMDLKALPGGNWDYSLNQFNGFVAASPSFGTAFAIPNRPAIVGSYQSGNYACFDSWGTNVGFAYMGLADGNIYKVSL
ncbi:MAG: hypothetical protein JWM80_5251 [Cyanobacteria bacterium RYN_339]|nr:hypothetical protein [Cyanobacteria bacterium RYN_339]